MPRSPVRNSVQIYLRDPTPNLNFRIDGPPSTRLVELSADNDWTVRVGRATTTGTGPDEEDDNACYRSRVVSREHAYITADPDTEVITVTDTESMHGTHVHGQRLRPNSPHVLEQDDVITFGAAVERGDETFLPIVVEVSWEWIVEEYAPVQASTPSNYPRVVAQPQYASNTFAVPDLSDDEIDDFDVADDNEAKAEPNRFTVPDSDHSDNDDSGVTSDSIVSDVESPSSSPVASHHSVELASKSASSAPVKGVQTEPHNIVQPQDADYAARHRIGAQSRVSIAELLENQAERMSSFDKESVVLDEPQDQYPSDDEDPDEDFDDLSEVDDFDGEIDAIIDAKSTLQVPDVAPVQRDPSPSDAAMVKPVSEGVRAPPFASHTAQQELPASVNLDLDFRSDSAWAGHNSVLYDPPMPIPSIPDFFSNAVPPTIPRQYPTPSWAPVEFYHPNPAQMPVAPPYSTYQPSFSQPLSRKRKAEEQDTDSNAAGPSGDAPVGMSAQEDEATENEVPQLTVSSLADIIKSPAPPAAEPPRKKQKTDKKDTRSRGGKGTTFTKYAVTALTGAAIGAVGTVLGLAALPQDFFV